MGYDVHITRAADWPDSEASPIPLEEWLAYVSRDPEMRLDRAAEVELDDGSVLRYESDGLAVWTAYSGHGVGGNMAWFDHRLGCISVKNPDREILGKMLRIAASLGARVQGDDGETYTTPDDWAEEDASILQSWRYSRWGYPLSTSLLGRLIDVCGRLFAKVRGERRDSERKSIP